MDFSGLELLSDVAALQASFRQSVMDIGVGPACADAAGPERADATRPAHADAARSAYPTRHNAVHVNEREKTEAKPVLMNDPANDVIDNMMDFYVDRKDAALHERYSTEDSSRRQLPMMNRDVPEELLIEFDGL